jgi:calcineurin-like phosphoesterase family protein
MHEALIGRYNDRVYPGDEVYFLGDVFFGHNDELNTTILQRMNGTKLLIRGNHDKVTVSRFKRWGFADVVKSLVIEIGSYRCLLRHRPLEPGDDRRLGVDYDYLVHGHTHGPVKREGFNIHVGVDAWNYYPVRDHEIARLLENPA